MCLTNAVAQLVEHSLWKALVAQLDVRLTGDQEVAGSTPAWLVTFFPGK